MEFRTKEDQVADYLREAILSGSFPRGARLKQVELAQMLQISITPVREALRILETEGYVEAGSYRGATVAPFDAAASAEVVNLRRILEAELVQAAVPRLTAADLEALRALEAEFADAVARGDSGQARGVNYRLHRRLYDVAQLPITLRLVQTLWARYPFDLINRIPGRTGRAVEEHAAILDRMTAGDIDGAVEATRQHIETGWVELRSSERGGAG